MIGTANDVRDAKEEAFNRPSREFDTLLMEEQVKTQTRTIKMMLAIVAGLVVALVLWAGATSQSAPAATSARELKTPWGEPDLQGIWTDETETPLERPAKYANQEFFTEEQRAELDRERAKLLGRDRRAARGTIADVAGAYNAVFNNPKKTGVRTSLIIDPPNGRIPDTTPEFKKIAAQDRAFRLALIQSTDSCKSRAPQCAGGKYDPNISPRFNEQPPRYNTAAMNRSDGPEDRPLPDRCLANNGGTWPVFGSNFGGVFVRIVQTPGGITMYFDIGQGQGFQRNIGMNRPHLAPIHRHSQGDSVAHWEGNTLVIDVTNFSPKMDFRGSRENLHLVEHWTRTGPQTIDFRITIEDPTVWTRPWTVQQTFIKQSDEQNKIYYEPRCHEGNYALAAILLGARMQEQAFAEGRGPDPRGLTAPQGEENDEVNPLAQ